MAVYAIADLHLSTNPKTNKSMDVFGNRWKDYMDKLNNRWRSLVCDDDSVIIPGDISWALTLDDSLEDMRFLDSLPGKKYIGKGNHDFWWATASKMNRFFKENHINSLEILYNNAYYIQDGIVICGTRGWFLDDSFQKTVGEVDFDKISARETLRFELSLVQAKKTADEVADKTGVRPPVYAFLHFPPIWGDFKCRSMLDLLDKYEVEYCYFGHIHGSDTVSVPDFYNNTKLKLISSDHLEFYPYKIL